MSEAVTSGKVAGTASLILGLNDVTIAGVLDKDPTTTGSDTGPVCTSARLCLAEERDGQVYRTFVSVDTYNKAAQTLAEMQAGDVVLIRGALKWKSGEKQGQKTGTLVVRGWSVQRLVAAEEVSV